MAIQQLDLGAVFNTLAQQRALKIQEQNAGQQGQLNALQMARYRREDDQAQKQQNALARLSDPSLDETGRRNILGEAFPELLAKQAFRERDIGMTENGTMWDKNTGQILRQESPLDGESVSTPQTAPQAAPRPTLAPGGHGPVPMPAQREGILAPTYAQTVKSIENTTGNPNARNPNSSATGDGQFIESTWLDMMSRHAPGLTQGKSREEILSMRGDPELSAKMTDLYGQENQAILERNGVEADPAILYSAHHIGAGATIKMLKADPNTPLSAILSPEAIKADPHLAQVTAGQAVAELRKKFAGTQMPGGAPQQTAEAPQQSNYGWSRVKSTKTLGLPDPPSGKIWQGRRRADGSGYDTRLVTAPGGENDVRNLTPEEIAAAGLSPGTVAQRDANGKVSVIKEGDKPQTNKDVAEVERGWRSDFKEPIKQSRELTSQLGIIRNSLSRQNGTGDMAGIIGFNKLLDPGAVVREADVDLTLKAQGLVEQLATWTANKKEGDLLPQPLRDKMMALSEEIYNTSNGYLRDGVMTYREAIEHGGGNFDRVLPPQMRKSLGWEIDPNAPKPETQKPKAETKVADVTSMSNDDLLRNLGIGK